MIQFVMYKIVRKSYIQYDKSLQLGQTQKLDKFPKPSTWIWAEKSVCLASSGLFINTHF